MGVEQIKDALAERVLTAYADGLSRFNAEKGCHLGLDKKQSGALKSAFGSSPEDGFISAGEQETLRRAGFSETFVATLAGNDGKEALRQRALWLSENALSYWYRPGNDRTQRAAFLGELKTIGALGVFSQDVLANVIQAARDDEPMVRDAAIETLAAVGRPTDEVIRVLDKARLSDSRMEAWSATDALLQLAEKLRLENKKLPKALAGSLRSIAVSANDANHRFQAVGLQELKLNDRIFAGTVLHAYCENPGNFTRQSFIKLGMTENQVDDLERVLGPSGKANWAVDVVEGDEVLQKQIVTNEIRAHLPGS